MTAIELNHTIVPAHDKVTSATFFARIFGLPYQEEPYAYFAAVRVNEALTLDFANSTKLEIHHYAKVSEDDFDTIFARIKTEGIPYGSEPNAITDMNINHRGGGRGVYFRDPNGHIFELLTAE